MSTKPAAGSFRDRGGSWVVAQSVLMLAVLALGALTRGAGTNVALIVLGALFVALGGFFGIAGARGLGRNRTPYPRPLPDGELVQSGIYAWVRHPLYTSVILVSLGWALIWQSRVAFLVALALGPFFYAKARREERWLRDRFPGYLAYAKRVPRFVPRLKLKTTDAL